MTLNQLPAYATSLMQMRQSAAVQQSANFKICEPAADGFAEDAEDSHAKAYAQALREAKLRRQRQQVSANCVVMPKPNRRSQCWQHAAAEEQRQPASKVYHESAGVPLPDDMIESLRDEALLVQLMIMKHRHSKGSPTSKALFARLEQVQKVLQREVEHEAQRLRHRQPASSRCGNFIDELS